ncbi:MAG: ribosome biogenesis GTP-binding protein YihA/YsxC [Oscillospiraceae bacterium]|nr:ribosome biogenesis GTP-binding protein YihA/YsxC [Oscillospiraceae bacterium]
MEGVNLNRVEFIRSAADVKQFIYDSRKKIAFAGRSNVGKSSVINCLLNRRQFARVGATPGKTIHVNYFLLDEKLYFVDLPGYGYAKVSESERLRWAELMERFFESRSTFDSGVLIVDARHKPTANDRQMAAYFLQTGKPFTVLANKVDKLKKSELQGNLETIRSELSLKPTDSLIPFSAVTKAGRESLLRELSLI